VTDSQGQCGVRHGISSPAQTLESRVRIPLEAWLSAFILCLCCPVQVGAYRRAVYPSEGSYQISEFINSEWAQDTEPICQRRKRRTRSRRKRRNR
jgi:hypothetical protein